jgi:AcrR family transcriptional regulator
MPSPTDSRRRGRPRRAGIDDAALDAAWELLEHAHVRDLTIEAVAQRAGVSKPTIYRRWPNKTALAVDAVLRQVRDDVRYVGDGPTAEVLTGQIARVITFMRGRPGRVMAELLAEAQSDPDTLIAINARYLGPRRAEARALIERGKERGEIAADVDPDLAIDLIYGPLYYRLMTRHLPLTKALAGQLVQQALRGLAPDPDAAEVAR